MYLNRESIVGYPIEAKRRLLSTVSEHYQKGIMVFPMFKLGTLAFRTLCKPIATKLKTEAGRHPKFRKFIISIAQANHRLSTTLVRYNYGRATDVVIRPLNEEMAVQAATNLLGELFLFAVAGGVLIYEVHRNAKKEEAAKQKVEEEKKKQELLKEEVEFHKQRQELLAKEVELLKSKVSEVELLKSKIIELEKLANSQGFFGVLHWRKPVVKVANTANAA